MEVIGHDYKFMQKKLPLEPVAQKSINEGERKTLRLKKAPFLECGSRDEVDAESGVASGWCSHKNLDG